MIALAAGIACSTYITASPLMRAYCSCTAFIVPGVGIMAQIGRFGAPTTTSSSDPPHGAPAEDIEALFHR